MKILKAFFKRTAGKYHILIKEENVNCKLVCI